MLAGPLLGAGARHAGHHRRVAAEQARDARQVLSGKASDNRRDLPGEELGAAPGSVLVVAQNVPELAVQRVQRDRDYVRDWAAYLAHDLGAAAADAVTRTGPGPAHCADAGASGGHRRGRVPVSGPGLCPPGPPGVKPSTPR